ncbi:MAG TPA: TauD/TfdA family dioxygenase [Acidimicrobiales bacterium]|nr:TauD/TfdA family dioxygenase [Acidimicrobiales bacterium]
MTSRQPVQSSAAWLPADITDPSEWTTVLTPSQRADIVAAANSALAVGKTVTTVDREAFDLPELRPVVETTIAAMTSGRGFHLLRGFPVDELSPAAVELAYVGLGLQLGTPVGQDANASILSHVRDEGVARTGPEVRLYRTRERQDFHTDGSDIVGLLCLQRAIAGGESRIASSFAVYNEILRRRPDLLDLLYEPMYWDRNNEQSEGEDPFFAMPVLNDVNGMPRVFYIGWYIRDAQRHAAAPRLTTEQLEALDLIESIANDPAFHVEMRFEPGDIQFLANAKILHSREAFEDDPDPERRRHLLRLWLTAHDFTSVDDVLRGGIPARSTGST